MHKLFFICLLAAIVCSLGCAAQPGGVPTPELISTGSRITGIDWRGVDLTIDLTVSNPYPVAIHSPEMTYTLTVNGAAFLRSSEPLSATLPKRANGTISIPIRLTYIELFELYQSLKNDTEAGYAFTGNVIIPILGHRFDIPVRHEGTFPVLHPPRISNLVISYSSVSLRGASVTGRGDINNPNGFPLGLDGVGYALSLGQVEVGGLAVSSGETLAPGASGVFTLTGSISAAEALAKLLRGYSLGEPQLQLTGSLTTPYGEITLP